MKTKIKKLKIYKMAEFEIEYDFEGERIKRKVVMKDHEFYQCDGFIKSKELKYLKEILEEYFY